MYKQNGERLLEVGIEPLEAMLHGRNWDVLPAKTASAKAQRARELLLEEGKLSASNEEFIRALGTEAVIEREGVCPFPHSTALDKDSDIDSSANIIEYSDKVDEGIIEVEEGEVEIDYLALADSVEEWLQLEEEQRNHQ